MCEFKSPMTNYKILNSALALMPLKIHELTYKKKRVVNRFAALNCLSRAEPIFPAMNRFTPRNPGKISKNKASLSKTNYLIID